MKAIKNAKAVAPDGLPVEQLKLGLQIRPGRFNGGPPTDHLHLARGKSPTAVKETLSLLYPTRTTKRSALTIAASPLGPTRVRCSLKGLPGDLRDCREVKGPLPEEQSWFCPDCWTTNIMFVVCRLLEVWLEGRIVTLHMLH